VARERGENRKRRRERKVHLHIVLLHINPKGKRKEKKKVCATLVPRSQERGSGCDAGKEGAVLLHHFARKKEGISQFRFRFNERWREEGKIWGGKKRRKGGKKIAEINLPIREEERKKRGIFLFRRSAETPGGKREKEIILVERERGKRETEKEPFPASVRELGGKKEEGTPFHESQNGRGEREKDGTIAGGKKRGKKPPNSRVELE